MNVTPALLAVLLVLSPVLAGGGVSAGAGASPAVTGPSGLPAAVDASPSDRGARGVDQTAGGSAAGDNETRVLAIPPNEVRRSGLEHHGIDLGAGVGFGANASAARIETYAVLAHVDNASTDAERRSRIRGAVKDIDKSVERLRGRERRAIAAYGEGDISGRELLVRLASIQARAAVLGDRLDRLTAAAEETEGFELNDERVTDIRFRLRAFEGPIRERMVAVLRGEAPPTRVYVATGEEAFTLSTVVGAEYVRETYRGDRRGNATGDITPDAAAQVVQRSYPTIWATRTPSATDGLGSGSTFVFEVPHDRGELTAYVDGSTGEVFKAVQTRPTDTYADRPSVTNQLNGLNLTVNRTYPGGPLRVHVENRNGEPVSNATVRLDAQNASKSVVVGRTDGNGDLWTLSPRGQFGVSAVVGDRPVVVTLEPTPPPMVNATSDGGDPSSVDGDSPADGESSEGSGAGGGSDSGADGADASA